MGWLVLSFLLSAFLRPTGSALLPVFDGNPCFLAADARHFTNRVSFALDDVVVDARLIVCSGRSRDVSRRGRTVEFVAFVTSNESGGPLIKSFSGR